VPRDALQLSGRRHTSLIWIADTVTCPPRMLPIFGMSLEDDVITLEGERSLAHLGGGSVEHRLLLNGSGTLTRYLHSV
jgi:hypothetical protein